MLTVVLTDYEKGLVTEALNDMFVMQGRKPDKDRAMLLMDGISHYGYSLQQILAGIKSLHGEALKAIRLYDIKTAVEEKVERINIDSQYHKKCQYCEDTGAIFVREIISPFNSFALACSKCEKGDNLNESTKNEFWNGEMEQKLKGRT